MYEMTYSWTHAWLWCAAWWLLASIMLWFSWNKVVARVSSLGVMKLWQALLLVLTMIVFCGPHHMQNRWNMHNQMRMKGMNMDSCIPAAPNPNPAAPNLESM